MASVPAEVVELTYRILERLVEQGIFVERGGGLRALQSVRGPGHHHKVPAPDPSREQGAGAVAEIADAIADLAPIGHRRNGHIAADAKPAAGTRVAQRIRFIGG